MSSRGTNVVGAIIAVLILGAVASIGYYQVAVAPGLNVTSTTSTTPAITCPSSACVNVTIPNAASSPPGGYTPGSKTTFGYSPDSITIVIGKNSTVFWTNDDVAIHTSTSDSGAPSAFDSGNIVASGTSQYTFTVAGTYTYHCSYHAWMQGTIIVKSA